MFACDVVQEVIEIGAIVCAGQLLLSQENEYKPVGKKRRGPVRDWIQRRNAQQFIFREFEEEDRQKFTRCFR